MPYSVDGTARKALALLEALRCEPTPEAYAVAYAHVSNPEGAVARAVEDAVLGGRLDEWAIRGIHEREIQGPRNRRLNSYADASRAHNAGSLDAVQRAEAAATAFMTRYDVAMVGLVPGCTATQALESAAKLREAVASLASEQEAARRELAEARDRMAELQARYERAMDEARSDGLTKLLNRRAFEERTEEAFAAGGCVSLVVLDIDRFKAINDSYGHAAGDGVIRAVADTLRASVRTEDAAARIGGEEFAVLLPGVDAAMAASIGERIRAMVERLRPRESLGMPRDTSFTVSVGVAAREAREGWQATLGRADARLYEAKRGGRNRVVSEAPTPVAA